MRALAEVVAAAEVDVTERLEVRNRPGTETGLLRRGEPEEELGRLRNQVGARDLRSDCHLLRQRTAAVEPAAGETATDRGQREELRVADPLRRVVDVRARVGAQQDRHLVRLEPRVERVALEALRVEQYRPVSATVVRQIARKRVRRQAVEIRQTPGNRHTETGGRRIVIRIEPGEQMFELTLGSLKIRAACSDVRRQDLVMEWRDEHLDALRVDDPHAVEQMLLGKQPSPGQPLGRAAGELVDQLVDPGRADCAGRCADDHLPSRQLHQAGLIRTSEASSRFR